MIFLEIFLVGFFVNLVWEVLHSTLYTTCHEMPLGKMQRLLVTMSLKDGFFITLFYYITVLIFKSADILSNYYQVGLFLFLALTFSFLDETYSVKKGRWVYSSKMPKIFGVGVTPLLEIAVTGLVSFWLIFFFL